MEERITSAMIKVETIPFDDQKPGTSGLRKKVNRFQSSHYLENFVQCIFDSVPDLEGGVLVIGGDGRYYNDVAVQTILKMAAANGVAHTIVGQHGLLSTPAASHIIRKYKAVGGIILSASHNPAGPSGDFGIKYNVSNGGPAPEAITDKIYARSKVITSYKTFESADVDISEVSKVELQGMKITVIDPVVDYTELMKTLFDFEAIKKLFKNGFTMCFDAMNAITGPYAEFIFVDVLGAPEGSIIYGEPLADFGGGHPDPNPVHAKTLFELMHSPQTPDFGAASDGDGDRNIVLGKGTYVAPSDSLAVLAANAHLAPAYKDGLLGLARSMPTSRAVDYVAKDLAVDCYETPTGWKFFGNLLDDKRISLCGEESAGTSSDHIREKDGLWAVLLWLNILAVRDESVTSILSQHWQKYGRNYYTRYDYEDIETEKAEAVMAYVRSQLGDLVGKNLNGETISKADSFTYKDPVDGSVSDNQGLRIEFESGSRFVLRLSGTGTVGATIRLYVERYMPPTGELELKTAQALEKIVDIALQITNIKPLINRDNPSVIS